jgi:hypothetical protein
MKGNTMQRLYFHISILILALSLVGCASNANVQPNEVKALEPTPIKEPIPTATEVASSEPPANCPVTLPEKPLFTAPEPLSPNAPWEGMFWFGSEHLWTALNINGVWSGLPHNREGYTQKIMWWSSLFNLKDELEPALVVFGKRLDAEAPPLIVSRATNAMAPDIKEAMLIGVGFPTLGCWEITGQYKKTGLTFVVWVTSEE